MTFDVVTPKGHVYTLDDDYLRCSDFGLIARVLQSRFGIDASRYVLVRNGQRIPRCERLLDGGVCSGDVLVVCTEDDNAGIGGGACSFASLLPRIGEPPRGKHMRRHSLELDLLNYYATNATTDPSPP